MRGRGVSPVRAAASNGLRSAASWRVEPSPRVERYRRDPFAHLDDGHVIVPDVETRQPVPFRPYEHEEELIASWVDLDRLEETGELRFRNVHDEKSRRMGISWSIDWTILWALLYHPVAILLQDIDLGRIDNGGWRANVESHFGRILYMARSRDGIGWPDWLAPLSLLDVRQAPEHVIASLETDGFVIGRGEEPDPAQGGSFDAYVGDEFARIPWADAVQASVIPACPSGRLYNSTPFGEDNEYARLKRNPQPDVIYLRHHWSIHPIYGEGKHVAGEDDDCARCGGVRAGVAWTLDDPWRTHRYPGRLTSPWYDEAVVRLRDDERIAQELDIEYARALTARVLPAFAEDTHVVDEIPFDPTLSLEFSWDFGLAAATAVGVWQEAPRELRKIGEVEIRDATPREVVAAVDAELERLGVSAVARRTQLLEVGDPAGEAREIGSGESLFAIYRRLGHDIVGARVTVEQRIRAVRHLLLGWPKPVRYSRRGCSATIRHLKGWRWPTDRGGNVRPGVTKPAPSEHSHMCDADSYYVAWKYPVSDEDDLPTAPRERSLDYDRGRSELADLAERDSGQLRADMRF